MILPCFITSANVYGACTFLVVDHEGILQRACSELLNLLFRILKARYEWPRSLSRKIIEQLRDN